MELADELEEDILGSLFIDCGEHDTGCAVKVKMKVRRASVEWMANLAKKLYFTSVQDLLLKHPVDSVDEDGAPIWSGTRRAPKALAYSGNGE